MRTAPRSTVRTGALLFALLMLLADVSGGLLSNPVSATQVPEFEEPFGAPSNVRETLKHNV